MAVGAVISLLALGQTASAQSVPKGNGKVKVFILAGQSNMQGHADLRTLDHLGADPQYGYLLKKLKAADGSYTTRDDVWIYYDRGQRGGVKKGPLTAGYGASDRELGPEWMFGQVMGDHFDNQVLLIKTAWGGQSLAVDFRPPSAGQPPLDQYPEKLRTKLQARTKEGPLVPGPKYSAMIETVRKVLANLKGEFPQYQGQGYELAGFFWFQGWNDMLNTDFTAEYQKNMTCFIKDLRKDLNAPNLPVVIGVIGVGGKTTTNAKKLALRKAQTAVGQQPEFQGTVTCVQTADYWDEQAGQLLEKNYVRRKWTNKEAQEQFGKMGSQPGYHYLGSAKILSLIGYGCGNAMIELITEKKDLHP
jgi:alpha-galactosidase